MSDNFEKDRKRFLEKLSKTNELFKKIDEIDNERLVIKNFEDRQALDILKSRNDFMLKKIDKGEFTVAIVGLDKAGKSTFANALIEEKLLPAEIGRCTFTTTEIRASETGNDEIEIEFFTQKEFENRLKDMFVSLDYSGELSAFESFWNSLEPEKKPTDVAKTNMVEDIFNILNDDTYSQYLGRPILPLNDPDPKKQREKLKYFITGIENYEIDPTSDGGRSAKKCSVPYAVKNIIIRSRLFKEDMKDIVLYDVPGFNSPTKIHKEQTLDKMKTADAIIFVTEAIKPSLESSQLDVFRINEDNDGIKLNRKTFVFGNQIDRANNEQDAKDAKATLKTQIKKYDIADESRIIVGSAKACLERLNKWDDDSHDALDDLKKLQISSDGIEEIHKQLRDYYNNDRYIILKERAENILKEIEQFLNELLEKYNIGNASDVEAQELMSLAQDISDLINKEFNSEATKIYKKHKDRILNGKIFSNQLKNNLESIFQKNVEVELELEKIRNNDIHTNEVDDIEKNDIELRKKLEVDFIKNLVQNIANTTDNEREAIYIELVGSFLDVIKAKPKNKTEEEELKSLVRELFSEYLNENVSHCYFNVLMERFAAGLVEVFSFAYGSSMRREAVEKIELDLVNLAQYYGQNDEELLKYCDENKKETDPYVYIVTKILRHFSLEEYFKYSDDDARIELWAETFRPISNEDEMLSFLKDDIDILIDITKKSLLDAMALETVFVRVINKNLTFIRDGLEKDEHNRKRDWISKNIEKIRYDDVRKIKNEREANEKRRDIVKSISEVLKDWKNN